VSATVNKTVCPRLIDDVGGMIEHGMARYRPIGSFHLLPSASEGQLGNAMGSMIPVSVLLWVNGGVRFPFAGQCGAEVVVAHRVEPMKEIKVVVTVGLEVKFLDSRKSTRCESARRGIVCQSRTRVRGSKTIRYRCSPLP